MFDPRGLDAVAASLPGALDIAAHRGPDGRGTAWFDTHPTAKSAHTGDRMPDGGATAFLGHRRLSIIELSELGHQPMASSDGAVWITYNGEIYNFVELRTELAAAGLRFRSQSDTEVVLRAYEFWGPDAATRFVGMWAYAILDLRARRLVLSRDRFGIKPLHLHRAGARVIFASEIKQLLEVPGVPRALDREAAHDYLRHEIVDIGTRTFFAGIERLAPGHNLVISLDDGEASNRAYASPPMGAYPGPIAPKTAAREFGTVLRDSVRLHLRADVAVGTCLSGGVDSGAIALLVRDAANSSAAGLRRHAFNCHFAVPEADEMEFTRMTVAASGVDAHFVEPTEADLERDLRRLVWHQDEPFASTSIFAQWSVFRLARDTGVKVVLDGQGADEALGGYASLAPFFFQELLVRGRPLAAIRESRSWAKLQARPWRDAWPLPGFVGRLKRRLRPRLRPAWLNADFERDAATNSLAELGMIERPFGARAPFANALHRFVYRSNLPALLRYEDRNSMAFSVEARVPFLDHRLVELAFALPSDVKFRDGYAKRILRDAMAGSMPEPVRMRARKMGFATPERAWQNGVLRPMIHDALASTTLEGIVDRAGAVSELDAIDAAGRTDFLPWRWLNLHLWRQEFRA